MPLPHDSVTHVPARIALIAERLCGSPVIGVDLCTGGANNRVYRISTARAAYAMKCYAVGDRDDRDRLGHEFDGLRFLKRVGIGRLLPEALAVDRESGCALYEWIDGAPVDEHGTNDIAALLELFGELQAASGATGATALPVATEAVLRLADLRAQIDVRLERLVAVMPTEPELAAFLGRELRPELARRLSALGEWDFDAQLPLAHRTLSPSDVGFHNALRRPDGSLAFIDFEYFGWDDPVKLTADVLWHPGMELSAGERQAFIAGARRLYARDARFGKRLEAYYPLIGIRWMLIILNEFVPAMWERRAFSGKGVDRDTAKRNQLVKARARMSALRAFSPGDHFV